MQDIVLAPELVHRVHVPAAGFGVSFEAYVTLAAHEVHSVVAVAHGLGHVLAGAIAEREAVAVRNQSPQTL